MGIRRTMLCLAAQSMHRGCDYRQQRFSGGISAFISLGRTYALQRGARHSPLDESGAKTLEFVVAYRARLF